MGELLDNTDCHDNDEHSEAGEDKGNDDVCYDDGMVVPYCSWYVSILFDGCLTSQQHASVSNGRICSDNFTCCHTEIEVADQTFHLTQSQYTDTGPTSPSTDPITPGPGRVATGVPIFKSLV